MKLLYSFLLTLFFLLTLHAPVQAHILKTDGSIGAVLHVSPEDDPIAGVESNFFFEFKDRNNQFHPDNCDCVIQILQAGKEVYKQDLFQNNDTPSLTNASFAYTFPHKDIYTVKVQGKPTMPNTYERFTLTYDIRVERDAKSVSSETDYSTYIVYFVIGAVLFFLLSIFFLKKIMKGGDKK